MNQQHTPEPWNDAQLGEVRDDFGHIIAVTRSQKPILHADKANAARIVACVNVCAGIDPVAVKDMLHALGVAASWIDAHRENESTGEGQQARWVLDAVRAAIGKAERR